MKNINAELVRKILIIIGLLTVLTIIIYCAFLTHVLIGIFTVGIILLFFGGILIP